MLKGKDNQCKQTKRCREYLRTLKSIKVKSITQNNVLKGNLK